MGVNKDKFKVVLKEFIASQQSYKKAIKHYYEYREKYIGVRYSDVPADIRDAVVKCRYSIRKLQSKSNEVRLILKWLHGYQTHKVLETDPKLPKSVKNTIKKIIAEVIDENFIHVDVAINPSELW